MAKRGLTSEGFQVRITSVPNGCPRGDSVCHGHGLGTDVGQGRWVPFIWSWGGGLVAELVTLNEIYHINASTLITPVNQQGFGLSESCLLLPPKNATSSLLLISSAHAYLSSIYSGKLKLRRSLNKTCLNYAIHSGCLDRWVLGPLFKTNLREQM